MKFNTTAIKSAGFSALMLMSTIAMANPAVDNYRQFPAPSPTPYCPTDPTGPNGPSAVPEPSAWVAYAIGIAAIVALTAFNKAKAAKLSK